MTQTDESTAFAALQRQQYANLFTYRKSGEAVKTPIWFAQSGDKLYVMTVQGAGKVKRIRNNSKVLIGPSDQRGTPLGPTVEGKARVLNPDEAASAKAALDKKYGLMKMMFDLFMNIRRTKRDWIEISPA